MAVGFSANGVEIYSRLKFGKFAAVLGFEDYIPHDLNPCHQLGLQDAVRDPGRRMALLKIRLRVRRSKAGRLGGCAGKDVSQAAAIGFRYDFSWKTPHTE